LCAAQLQHGSTCYSLIDGLLLPFEDLLPLQQHPASSMEWVWQRMPAAVLLTM
jgi:hypothetical protein